MQQTIIRNAVLPGCPQDSGFRSESPVQCMSNRLRNLTDAQLRHAQLSESEARALAKAVKGDFDVIADKAVKKDPRHRYQSVGELADDIDRHMTG